MHSRRRPALQDQDLERRSGARRLFIDGVVWRVYELSEQDHHSRSGASLVFESDSTIRRVREYPTDWRTLSDEALLALSWSR